MTLKEFNYIIPPYHRVGLYSLDSSLLYEGSWLHVPTKWRLLQVYTLTSSFQDDCLLFVLDVNDKTIDSDEYFDE